MLSLVSCMSYVVFCLLSPDCLLSHVCCFSVGCLVFLVSCQFYFSFLPFRQLLSAVCCLLYHICNPLSTFLTTTFFCELPVVFDIIFAISFLTFRQLQYFLLSAVGWVRYHICNLLSTFMTASVLSPVCRLLSPISSVNGFNYCTLYSVQYTYFVDSLVLVILNK